MANRGGRAVKDYKAFLAELAELTKKHGVRIGGCGCCDSPFLCSVDEAEYGPGHLAWDSTNQTYNVSGE